jgi:3-hydroxyisobutyrate dehydrogenase-like beta-hydroxyacid dehydrogenase
MSTTSPQIGLIGLGNAGRALAQALGVTHTLQLFDRDAAQLAPAQAACAKAPHLAASAAELAAAVDILILSLPTPEASLAVARQVAPAIRPGAVVIETSTVGPGDVEALHGVLAPGGARVIDAAVVGGVHKLALGQGVFLVGAPEEEAGVAGALLRSIAEEIFFLNGRGDGMRAKLVANGVSHTAYVLLLEAAALAAAQKIPLEVFYRLMARESGLMRPLTHRFGERLRHGDFDGGMSTLNARKDSGLILETARALGVPVFAIAATHGVYDLAVAEGLGQLDYASMGLLWEKWLGISFRDEAAE